MPSEKKRIFSIPNMITISRVPLALVFAYFLDANMRFFDRNMIFAFLIIAVIGLTDFLDGYVARRLNQTSMLGKILDGICDKITMVIIVIALIVVMKVPWFVLLLLMRDFFVGLFSIYVLFRTRKMQIKTIGFSKITTALQFATILALFFYQPLFYLLFSAAILFSVLTIIVYLKMFIKYASKKGW